MAMVYLNGEILPADQAQVSVLDRGFIFGDGIYEVIPAYGQNLFRLDQHLERLQNNLDAIRIKNPLSNARWHDILQNLVLLNADKGTEKDNPQGIGDQSVYLQITRGVAQRDHAFPTEATPTVFIMSNPLVAPAKTQLEDGVATITLPDNRWTNCHIKAISLLPNILLRQQALDSGAVEAILIREGEATEGAASNLFIVSDGKVITPPRGPLLLPGITRDLILELGLSNHIECREAPVSEKLLNRADEIWLTSSTKEILPVSSLNGILVGDGLPGPVWKLMIALFQEYKHQLREGAVS